MNLKNLGLLIIIVQLVACAPTLNKQVGMLNLDYNGNRVQDQNTNLPIVIVDTNFLTSSGSSGARGVDFNRSFANSYKSQVTQAFSSAFQQMITERGFTVLGPYKTFDDLTYGDKNRGYLAVVPNLKLVIDQKITNSSRGIITDIYTEKGVFQVTGEFRIDFVEPLTNERIMTRRINLSDFHIERDYIIEIKGAPGFFGSIIASFMTINDNTDKVLTDAINDFYSNSIPRIEAYFSREEILSYNGQIEGLKNLKRF